MPFERRTGRLSYKENKKRPTEFREFSRALKEVKAMGQYRRWSEALADLSTSWEEIPVTEKAKRGDLILYRRDGEIPNIHGKLYLSPIILLDIAAYPDKINSMVKENGSIVSITVTESRWTSFRDPNEALRAFTDNAGNRDKAIRQLRNVGYLKDVQMVIPVADFRLFDDVNNFLTKKFDLLLPCLSQEREPFRLQ